MEGPQRSVLTISVLAVFLAAGAFAQDAGPGAADEQLAAPEEQVDVQAGEAALQTGTPADFTGGDELSVPEATSEGETTAATAPGQESAPAGISQCESPYEPFWINLAAIAEGSLTVNQPGSFRFGVGPQFVALHGLISVIPAIYFVTGIGAYDGPAKFDQADGTSVFSYEYRTTRTPEDIYGVGAAATIEFGAFPFRNGLLSVYVLGGVDYYVPQYTFDAYDPALTARFEFGVALWGYFDAGVQVGLSLGFLVNNAVIGGSSNFDGDSIGMSCSLKVVTDIHHLMKKSKDKAKNKGVTE